MAGLRMLTAGESHGPALSLIIDGFPAGVPLAAEEIDRELRRRQGGYGRGGRMAIERDQVEIQSGVRHGLTLGSPIALRIANRDWANWGTIMSSEPACGDFEVVSSPRPGHADLAGGMKYGTRDFRNILERASARETAARVAAGAVCKLFLARFGIRIASVVEEIGGLRATLPEVLGDEDLKRIEASPFRSADTAADELFTALIDQAAADGDTLGGVFLVVARGVVPGLGSYRQWDRRLDGEMAQAMVSIPGVKGVEFGIGFRGSHLSGLNFHDAILPAGEGCGGMTRFKRLTNRAGGTEGGISTGEDILIRAFMKPIPSTRAALDSVDVRSGEAVKAHHERSDVCAVPAAAVVGEAMCAWVLAGSFLDKFGGDSLDDVAAAYGRYVERIGEY